MSITKDRGVKSGDEGGALAAERDVFAPEIGDDGNARGRRDDIGVTDLERERRRETRSVTNGLPVATDRAHGAGRDARAREEFVHGLGEKLPQGDISAAETINLVFSRNAECEQFAPQGRGKRDGVRSDQLGLWVKLHEGDIDPVDAGARKRTDVELGDGRRVGRWRRTIHAKGEMSS